MCIVRTADDAFLLHRAPIPRSRSISPTFRAKRLFFTSWNFSLVRIALPFRSSNEQRRFSTRKIVPLEIRRIIDNFNWYASEYGNRRRDWKSDDDSRVIINYFWIYFTWGTSNWKQRYPPDTWWRLAKLWIPFEIIFHGIFHVWKIQTDSFENEQAVAFNENVIANCSLSVHGDICEKSEITEKQSIFIHSSPLSTFAQTEYLTPNCVICFANYATTSNVLYTVVLYNFQFEPLSCRKIISFSFCYEE